MASKKDYLKFIIIGFGVVLGFPLLVALGMETVSSSHGGVLPSFTPLSTALFSAILSKERPSWKFWGLSMTGLIVTSIFSISHNQTPSSIFKWSSGNLASLEPFF